VTPWYQRRCPAKARYRLLFPFENFWREILLFGSNEGSHFINLSPLAFQIAKGFVLKLRSRSTGLHQQFEDGWL
jgi:hypothetical protein